MSKILSLMLLFAATCAYGQETERDKIQQLQMQKEADKQRFIRQQMDSGVYYLNHEQYTKADEKLRFALNNMKSIPSDLAFFFGKNSYFIEKYKQSVDWLTKYIQLKGTNGQYSAEAADWLKKAEKLLVAQHQVESQRAVEVLSQDYTIDCGPNGKVTCPVCGGSTVIIRKDYLHGETYKTCPYCHKMGTLTCDEYNKLIKGQLLPSGN